MAFTKDYLYVGISPRVVAIDRRTGAVAWSTKLPGAGMGLVTVYDDDDRVYAGAHGEVWALDPASGNILWHNPLKGFGMHEVMFPGTRGRPQSRE